MLTQSELLCIKNLTNKLNIKTTIKIKDKLTVYCLNDQGTFDLEIINEPQILFEIFENHIKIYPESVENTFKELFDNEIIENFAWARFFEINKVEIAVGNDKFLKSKEKVFRNLISLMFVKLRISAVNISYEVNKKYYEVYMDTSFDTVKVFQIFDPTEQVLRVTKDNFNYLFNLNKKVSIFNITENMEAKNINIYTGQLSRLRNENCKVKFTWEVTTDDKDNTRLSYSL